MLIHMEIKIRGQAVPGECHKENLINKIKEHLTIRPHKVLQTQSNGQKVVVVYS